MSRAWPVKGIAPDASLAENARRILAVRMGEFYSYEPVIAIEEAIEPLHDMRIAAKRLRYTLELFEVVFGKLGKQQIERIKAVQEDLGTLHDFDVRIELMTDELRTLTEEEIAVATNNGGGPNRQNGAAPDVRRGLLKLLSREKAARRERYHAFVARWNNLRAEGMRGDLARLSSSPIAVASDDAAPVPQSDDTGIGTADTDAGNGEVTQVAVATEPNRYGAAF